MKAKRTGSEGIAVSRNEPQKNLGGFGSQEFVSFQSKGPLSSNKIFQRTPGIKHKSDSFICKKFMVPNPHILL